MQSKQVAEENPEQMMKYKILYRN